MDKTCNLWLFLPERNRIFILIDVCNSVKSLIINIWKIKQYFTRPTEIMNININIWLSEFLHRDGVRKFSLDLLLRLTQLWKTHRRHGVVKEFNTKTKDTSHRLKCSLLTHPSLQWKNQLWSAVHCCPELSFFVTYDSYL